MYNKNSIGNAVAKCSRGVWLWLSLLKGMKWNDKMPIRVDFVKTHQFLGNKMGFLKNKNILDYTKTTNIALIAARPILYHIS